MSLEPEEKKRLDDAVTEFIVEDCQPFNLMESRAFRKLLKKFNNQYTAQGRDTVEKKALALCREVEEEVRQ